MIGGMCKNAPEETWLWFSEMSNPATVILVHMKGNNGLRGARWGWKQTWPVKRIHMTCNILPKPKMLEGELRA